jgi:RNA polymerase sigma-70 factor, ECF subfamily
LRDDPNSAPSDAELMAGLSRGEIGCLEPLYLRYGDAVFRVVRGVLARASSDEADDICQNVFLTVLEAAPRYQETGSFRSWLFGIAVRKARSWQRRRWFRDALLQKNRDEAAAPVGRGPDEMVDMLQHLERALRRLTVAQREVFLLRASEGLSGSEIAEVLGISLNAVFTRLHRAQIAVGEFLEEEACR